MLRLSIGQQTPHIHPLLCDPSLPDGHDHLACSVCALLMVKQCFIRGPRRSPSSLPSILLFKLNKHKAHMAVAAEREVKSKEAAATQSSVRRDAM